MLNTIAGAGEYLREQYNYPWPQGAHVPLGKVIVNKKTNMEKYVVCQKIINLWRKIKQEESAVRLDLNYRKKLLEIQTYGG